MTTRLSRKRVLFGFGAIKTRGAEERSRVSADLGKGCGLSDHRLERNPPKEAFETQKGRPTWIPRLYRRKTNGEIAEGKSPALVFGRPLGRAGGGG